MDSIKHNFEYDADASSVSDALISGDQIARWWTTSAELKPEIGAIGTFKWPSHGWMVKIKLEQVKSGSYVEWTCIESNMQNTNAWKDTSIRFNIQPNGTKTHLEFIQEGYEESPCREVCNDGWNFVLGTSLKSYLEKGVGQPYES